jgi:hypothetical protein
MVEHRRRVAVLQEEQFIEINLDRVFPPGEFEVVVFATGRGKKIWRDGVPHGSSVLTRTTREALRGTMADRGFGQAEVVTNDEMCIELVAQLRHERDQPRRHPAALSLYRDKRQMKDCLLRAGLSTPAFLAMVLGDEREEPDVPLPVVVKPADGVNSRGVKIIRSADELAEWRMTGTGEWLIEQYIEGQHFHVNAIVRNGSIEHVVVGRYLSSLLELKEARATGSLTVPDSDPTARDARVTAEAAVRALGLDGQFVTHAELIRDLQGKFWIIEVAARAPGALVSEVTELAAGVHLVEASYRLQAGLRVARPWRGPIDAAWIWLPLGELRGNEVRRPVIASPYRLTIGYVPPLGQRAGLTIGAQVVAWSEDYPQLEADVDQLAGEAAFNNQ